MSGIVGCTTRSTVLKAPLLMYDSDDPKNHDGVQWLYYKYRLNSIIEEITFTKIRDTDWVDKSGQFNGIDFTIAKFRSIVAKSIGSIWGALFSERTVPRREFLSCAVFWI